MRSWYYSLKCAVKYEKATIKTGEITGILLFSSNSVEYQALDFLRPKQCTETVNA